MHACLALLLRPAREFPGVKSSQGLRVPEYPTDWQGPDQTARQTTDRRSFFFARHPKLQYGQIPGWFMCLTILCSRD